MKIKKILLWAALSILAAFPVVGQDKEMEQVVSFLAGTWKTDGQETYEKWEKAGNSAFKGKGYKLADNEEKVTENLEIKNIDGKIYYLATVPNQNSGATIRFALTSSGQDELIFENPEHDFPKKIVYRKMSATEMFVRVLGGDGTGFSFKMTKIQNPITF